MKLFSKLFLVLGAAALLYSCSCGSSTPKYEKTPVDNLIRDMHNIKPFSIVLHDMDADEGFNAKYKHKYKIIKEEAGKVKSEITPWHEVSERFFAKHQDNMGMTIASKDSTGKIHKTPSPPGYSNYVGNRRYGSWQQNSSGQSFWQFYGQYAFMRDMLGMGHYGPVYRNSYRDYRTHYNSGRAYYGPSTSGSRVYGTRGTGTSRAYSKSTWSSKPSSFKQNVRSRVSRSSTSGSRTSSSSRSGSRYGSSSRSSGGGYGK